MAHTVQTEEVAPEILYMCLLIYTHVSIHIFWFMSSQILFIWIYWYLLPSLTFCLLWSAVVSFVFQWSERKQPDSHHQVRLLWPQTPQSPVSLSHIYYHPIHFLLFDKSKLFWKLLSQLSGTLLTGQQLVFILVFIQQRFFPTFLW